MRKQATFKVIHFVGPNRFVAVAHNYAVAVLIATKDHATYTEARAELDTLCTERDVELRWFDGEHECLDGETIFPKT